MQVDHSYPGTSFKFKGGCGFGFLKNDEKWQFLSLHFGIYNSYLIMMRITVSKDAYKGPK